MTLPVGVVTERNRAFELPLVIDRVAKPTREVGGRVLLGQPDRIDYLVAPRHRAVELDQRPPIVAREVAECVQRRERGETRSRSTS